MTLEGLGLRKEEKIMSDFKDILIGATLSLPLFLIFYSGVWFYDYRTNSSESRGPILFHVCKSFPALTKAAALIGVIFGPLMEGGPTSRAKMLTMLITAVVIAFREGLGYQVSIRELMKDQNKRASNSSRRGTVEARG